MSFETASRLDYLDSYREGTLPVLPKEFTAKQQTLRLYPVSSYTFGTKDEQPEEDRSVQERMTRLENHFKKHGMRRSCKAVIVCHEYGHPQVLLLQIANAFFKLPGDYLGPEDDEVEGLKARLTRQIGPTHGAANDWEVGDVLAQYWRPNFENFMYPYIPQYCSRPKETEKLFFIQLPKTKSFAVPKNMKFLAISLTELYDNSQRYGAIHSRIPEYLSRFRFEYMDENDNCFGVHPGGGPYYHPATGNALQLLQARHLFQELKQSADNGNEQDRALIQKLMHGTKPEDATQHADSIAAENGVAHANGKTDQDGAGVPDTEMNDPAEEEDYGDGYDLDLS